jgi:5-methylcytosine-specific restriction endonuclease McrA
MRYQDLLRFIERDMRMSHVYQPIMIRALLGGGGRASRTAIARHLLNADESQLDYYVQIVRNMVGRVLTDRGVVARDGQDFVLQGFERLTADEIKHIEEACDVRLRRYLEKRGDAPWEHRRRSAGYVSGSIKYEVLKRAKFRCELCGVPATECALEVDHILPRNRGGDDDLSNLQALCYRCNSMKRDRDDTDFRAVRESLDHREHECVFCNPADRPIVMENRLTIAIADRYPVTQGHVLVIPRRHEKDYFQLGSA